MGTTEIISSGEALSKLGAMALMCVYVVGITFLAIRLWRDGKADSREASVTYIALLREQFSDAGRRKDLFDEIGKAIDGLAQASRDNGQATRDLRQEITGLRADLSRRP